MRHRIEYRDGRKVSVIEAEHSEHTVEERLAALESAQATAEQRLARFEKAAENPA